MNKLFLTTLLFFPLLALAEEKQVKEGERKPASIEQELLQARLKLAEVLSRARLEKKTCDVDAYQTEILDLLSGSKYLEGFNVNQIPGSVQQTMAGVLAYNEVTGLNLSETSAAADFERALVNSYWESIGQGVYGPQYTFTLRPGGKVDIKRLEVLNVEPWYRYHTEVGQWTVQRRAAKGSQDSSVRVGLRLSNKNKVYYIQKNYENHGMWQLNRGPSNRDKQKVEFFNYAANECEA